jgi:hypothetical protein
MPDDKTVDEAKALVEITERLQEQFPETPREEIEAAVEFGRKSFENAKVRDFLPVLIEKEAKARLKGKR